MLLPRIWDEDLFENMDNWMSWPDESEFFVRRILCMANMQRTS